MPGPQPGSFCRSPRRHCSLSGQPALVLHHLLSTEVLRDGQKEPPVFQLVPIAFCTSTGHHWEEHDSVFCGHSLQGFMNVDEIALSVFSDWAGTALSLSSMGAAPVSSSCSWGFIKCFPVHPHLSCSGKLKTEHSTLVVVHSHADYFSAAFLS